MNIKIIPYILILFFIGCVTTSKCPEIGVIDESFFNINGITLHQKYENVREKLGEPISDEFDEIPKVWRNVSYPGIELSFDHGELVLITVTSDSWKLPNGITIGSTLETLVKEFGCTKEYIYEEEIYSAFRHNNDVEIKAFDFLKFKIMNNSIAQINFSTLHSRI